MRSYKILVIDANCIFLKLYAQALSLLGYGVTKVRNREDAIGTLQNRIFDLFICDEFFGKEDNVTRVLKEVKELQPEIKIMVASDRLCRDRDPAFQDLGLAPENFFRMPSSIDEMEERVRAILGVKTCKIEGAQTRVTASLPKTTIPSLPVLMHDIRSPLICIGAQLRLLQKGKYGELPETARAEVDKIVTRCIRLTQMAEEYLLTLAQEEKNTVQLPLETFYLVEDVVDPVLQELAEDMQENGFNLANRIEKNLFSDKRVFINGDKTWLKSVFRNLLGNAIKYGEKGGTIGIDIVKKAKHYQVNVCNSGAGKREKAMDRDLVSSGGVQAADQTEKERRRGMGVGLHLTRRIINNYGGEIWRESGDYGTKFVFTLPYEEALPAQID
ncbi:MAG: ATP-binding protein [Deltaproteobacteria bacterium]